MRNGFTTGDHTSDLMVHKLFAVGTVQSDSIVIRDKSCLQCKRESIIVSPHTHVMGSGYATRYTVRMRGCADA
eukprot:8833872-Pyramimonas_sp.AAC.2